MSSLFLLAQANPKELDITTGQVISVLLVLLIAFFSVLMMGIWIFRTITTGHAMPAAQRGVIRVPVPLMIGGGVVALLMLLLTLASSIAESAATPVAAVDATAEAQSDAVGADPDAVTEPEPDGTTLEPEGTADAADTVAATADTADTVADTADADDVDDAARSAESLETMRANLAVMLVFDLALLALFGGLVVVCSQRQRVRLAETTITGAPSVPAAGALSEVRRLPVSARRPTPETQASAWGDLDAAPAADQDYLDPDNPYLNTSYSESFAPPNPYATSDLQQRSAATDDESTVTEAAQVPSEPFSFLTELRYAGEVFLAAYVPTMVLRMIMVTIVQAITGEDAASHPFFDMLKSKIDVPLVLSIMFLAVVMAPIMEELLFRVVILGGIAQTGRIRTAMITASVMFAFAHGFPDSIALLPLAAALGYAYIRRRSYFTVIVVHFLFNSFNMVVALIGLS